MHSDIGEQARANVAAQEAEAQAQRIAAEIFRLEHAHQMAQIATALKSTTEKAKDALRP